MKQFYLLIILLSQCSLWGQSILDSIAFTKSPAMVIDAQGPGFFTLHTENGFYQFEHFDGQKQLVASHQYPTGLTVTNTTFCGVYHYPQTNNYLIVSKNRVNPNSPLGTNGYYAYSFVRYNYEDQQVITAKVDTFHLVEQAIVAYQSNEMYVFQAKRDNQTSPEQIYGYVLDTNLNLRLINADVSSYFARYGMMDLCQMETKADSTLLFTIALPGAYQTEQYDQALNLIQEQSAATYENNGTSQPVLYQRLNADSIFIFHQHRNANFKFIWELGWWQSPTVAIHNTLIAAPNYNENELYGNTYSTFSSKVVLDTVGRQLIILATRSNQIENQAYFQHIYYYDFNFNLICEDSLVLPDTFNRFTVCTIDDAVFLGQYNDTAVSYHPLGCGLFSSQSTEAPQNLDSVVLNLSNVFPNPSTGIFILANPDLLTTHLRVLNNQGLEVYQIATQEAEVYIDLGNFPSGIYFLESQQEGQISVQTLMLE
ncbi:MAG: T9SS type A sorting domain-containing protein [Flavobacteriales bacterium]